jgi:hypothetical protein
MPIKTRHKNFSLSLSIQTLVNRKLTLLQIWFSIQTFAREIEDSSSSLPLLPSTKTFCLYLATTTTRLTQIPERRHARQKPRPHVIEELQ